MATAEQQPQGDVLEQEPQDIADHASDVGQQRLDRSPLDIFLTAIIGGVEVSLGGIAAMTVVGSTLAALPTVDLFAALALGGLAFPIGFLFVIVGRSELFTENFLIPVVAVLKGERPAASLAELWGLAWLGNVLACAVMAALLSVPHAIGEPILGGYRAYADYKLSVPPLGTFVSAILAGVVMTALTWLLLAVRDAVARMAAIFAAGYLLFAANLSHSIVSSSVLFVGFHATSHGLSSVLTWLVLTTIGNLIGGVGLVTLFRLAQAREKERSDQPPAV